MDVNRRRFLAGLASAAAATGLAGVHHLGSDSLGPAERVDGGSGSDPGASGETDQTTTASASNLDRWRDQFATVVDVVEAGVTPDGTDPIDPVLRAHAGDDTLFYFPPGRYRMAGNWNRDSFSDVGLVGDAATIRPVDEPHDTLFTMGQPDRASGFLLEGIEFDFRDLAHVPRPFIARVDDDLLVRDVSVRGPSRAVRVDVNDPGGVGRVERLALTDSPVGAFEVGCLATDETHGEITFADCTIRGFPNNGLYTSSAKGRIRVLGGTYANNGIANVRVSGDSVVRGVTVVCDTTDQRFENMRGIWIRHGENALIENCDVHLRRVPSSDGAIPIAGSGTVRATSVRVDADDVAGINVMERTDAGTGDDGVAVEDAEVTGTASGGSAIQVADRRGCSFRDLRVHQTGAARDGVRLIRADEATIRNSDITVTGEPIRTERSTVETADLRTLTLASEPR